MIATIAALRRIKRLVPSDVMISLYKACVLPHIEYKPKLKGRGWSETPLWRSEKRLKKARQRW